jgi:L-2-hydroxyglutarate oxidase
LIKKDICIIGSGIVGLATAYQISRTYPDICIAVIEKENGPFIHQTGHNSGVIHTGIYYKPGSLKSVNCREGRKAMERFCMDEGIDYEICGKVIVAVTPDEIPMMEKIFSRGQQNGVKCKIIDRNHLNEIEPHAAGIKAIHVPDAGIVNYTQVCKRFIQRIKETGTNDIFYNSKVTAILPDHDKLRIITKSNEFQARCVINCAGLHSDRITRAGGQKSDVKIIPFRGEYFKILKKAHHLCKNLIYPVPNPEYPFLGVHFTRKIDGSVECGPNAVLAYAREGYTKITVNPVDLYETLTYPGFIRLASKFWKIGAGELWRSINKGAFVNVLQRLIPEIQSDDLVPAPAGVRAQAVSPMGEMIDDFMIRSNGNIINVSNAPSPAATSSINIGKHILSLVEQIIF